MLPTPNSWTESSVWTFHVVDEDDESLGHFTLSLTADSVETCSGGSWLRAEIVDSKLDVLPLEQWYTESDLYPAYEITGGALTVQLNAPICDNDVIVRGKLFESGAAGRISSEPAIGGGRLIGTFVAEKAQDK